MRCIGKPSCVAFHRGNLMNSEKLAEIVHDEFRDVCYSTRRNKMIALPVITGG